MRGTKQAHTLGEIRTEFVFVACWHCPRRGRYRVANIIAKYGPDIFGTDFLNEISANCDHHPALSTIKVCGSHFTDTMWLGEGPRPK